MAGAKKEPGIKFHFKTDPRLQTRFITRLLLYTFDSITGGGHLRTCKNGPVYLGVAGEGKQEGHGQSVK